MDSTHDRQHAIDRRDRAARSVRRLTITAAAAATAAAGVIAAAVGGGATGSKARVRTLLGATTPRVTVPTVPEPAATVTVATDEGGAATAPASAPSPPPVAPAPAVDGPVVISGGS